MQISLSHWIEYAHVVVSDALVYYKSIETSEMREFRRMQISLSHWIEGAFMVVSAALVYGNSVNTSEML